MELPKVVPQHIIDEEAQQIFRSFFNKKTGYLVQEYPEDYGLDYYVELIDEKGQTSGIYFNVQLKGIKKIQVKKDISVSLKKTTINLFSRQLTPTILIVIDISKSAGYWHNSFNFISELDKRHPTWRNDLGKTTTIHIPVSQELSPSEHSKIRQYAVSVHARRSAVPQGEFILMQPLKTPPDTLSIDELSSIVHARDYLKFIDVITANPYYYLSDLNLSILFNLFEQIPPKMLHDNCSAMAMFAIASYKKGYYQEARKWCQSSFSGGLLNYELSAHVELIQAEIDFMYGYITEQEYWALIEKISIKASPEMQNSILLRKIRLEFWQKDKEARVYGRFRQMNLIKTTIKQLWSFVEANPGMTQELAYLELGHYYSMLVPFLWMEIESTALMRGKVGLQLTDIEIQNMRNEAEQATNEAHSVFAIFVNDATNSNISTRARAEGLFAYAIYLYHLQVNKLNKIIFIKDLLGNIPDRIAISADESQGIKQALSYCETARKIFNTIGAKDREAAALVFILGFCEDLGEEVKSQEAKIEIEKSLKTNWVPNTAILFQQTINEGSLRARLIKYIAQSKKTSDFEKANTSEVEIEAQVECNSQTFNITNKNRIDNLRKDIRSDILAAKFRVEFCKHFDLLQDRRHTLSLTTLYAIDPNRKGVCQLFQYKSIIENESAENVISSFQAAYCNNCDRREPLPK